MSDESGPAGSVDAAFSEAPPRSPEIEIVPDAPAVSYAAAEIVAEAGRAAVERSGRFLWALSGGATPAALYRLLATSRFDQRIPWRHTHVLWGDERCVPPDDERSNYRLAADAGLLERPLAGIHRMQGELPPAQGARAYQTALRELWETEGAHAGEAVRLDLVLLGLGEDGHTASLFAGSVALREKRKEVVAVEPHGGIARISLSLAVLTAADHVLMLVTGRAKAAVVADVLRGPDSGLPAAGVLFGASRATLLLDRAAAGSM